MFKYKTKKERNEANSKWHLGKSPGNKGKRLQHNYECYACGSKTTFMDKVGRIHWAHNRDEKGNSLGMLCSKCNSRYVSNQRRNGHLFRIRFKDKDIRVPANPKLYICSWCGKATKTHMHHEEYDESNPLAHTIELCARCHRLETIRLQNS